MNSICATRAMAPEKRFIYTRQTLNRLRDWYPQGRFDGPRFRPNIVVKFG